MKEENFKDKIECEGLFKFNIQEMSRNPWKFIISMDFFSLKNSQWTREREAVGIAVPAVKFCGAGHFILIQPLIYEKIKEEIEYAKKMLKFKIIKICEEKKMRYTSENGREEIKEIDGIMIGDKLFHGMAVCEEHEIKED